MTDLTTKVAMEVEDFQWTTKVQSACMFSLFIDWGGVALSYHGFTASVASVMAHIGYGAGKSADIVTLLSLRESVYLYEHTIIDSP